MRILLSSYHFHPSIGGLETSSKFLAYGFAERGHDVTVVTATPGEAESFPFKVVRQPDARTLLRLVRDADLVWQNHISLRYLWPLFLVPRPLVFMHHIWLRKQAESEPRFGTLKRLACMMGSNVFVSKELRHEANLPGPIVPNSYDANTFRVLPGVERDRDIAFLGRLVHYKGADILIDAVARLSAQGMSTTTTVIGLGPEENALRRRAANAGVSGIVDFSGPVRGEALAHLLSRHRIVVVPSRWEEPFGIVALEALACGCVVVAADSGGLPEVVGPCGRVFPKEDSGALAEVLRELLRDPAAMDDLRRAIPGHLAKYDKATVLDACEAVLRDAVATASPSRLGWRRARA